MAAIRDGHRLIALVVAEDLGEAWTERLEMGT